MRLRKPSIQANAQDAREALGGVISIWAPGANCSCFGCLITNEEAKFRRGEVLRSTVTGTIASVAAYAAIQMLTSGVGDFARQHNLIVVDLKAVAIQSLSIRRRPSCGICGPDCASWLPSASESKG